MWIVHSKWDLTLASSNYDSRELNGYFYLRKREIRSFSFTALQVERDTSKKKSFPGVQGTAFHRTKTFFSLTIKVSDRFITRSFRDGKSKNEDCLQVIFCKLTQLIMKAKGVLENPGEILERNTTCPTLKGLRTVYRRVTYIRSICILCSSKRAKPDKG